MVCVDIFCGVWTYFAECMDNMISVDISCGVWTIFGECVVATVFLEFELILCEMWSFLGSK